RSGPASRNLLEQFKPFPAQIVLELHESGGIAARPRQAIDKAGADRIGDIHEHDWHRARRLQQRRHSRRATGQDYVRRECGQFCGVLANVVGVAHAPAMIDPQVAAVGPTRLLQRLQERRVICLSVGIVRSAAAGEPADPPHLLALLRSRRERPRSRAAEQRYELATPHSITSSATVSNEAGTVRPSIRAVTALMTSSNLLDCTTGRSAGLASLRMRPV